MKAYLLIASFALAATAGAQDYAVRQLEQSPRHHEWVTIPSGDGAVHAFVAYPERSGRARPVIVIHENRGLTDWVRSFADELAAAGYLAIAPDLLSGFDAERTRTSDFASSDAARAALYELDSRAVTHDLEAVRRYAVALPSAEGPAAVVGFCWGGAQAFRFATDTDSLAAAFVFYGSPPEAEAIPRIAAPVYGFYGEHDARINATIPDTERLMQRHRKTYDVEVYAGAGHAFMRAGDGLEADAATRAARDAAMARLLRQLNALPN